MFTLPDSSRTWIYKADRFLNENEVTFIEQKLNAFIPSWAAHGKQLFAEAKVVDNLWIIIAADEAKEGASGCSIDKVFRLITELENELNISFTNRLILAYQENKEIKLTPLSAIKDLGINAQTLIYDDTIQTLGDFHTRLRKAEDSWLKRML